MRDGNNNWRPPAGLKAGGAGGGGRVTMEKDVQKGGTIVKMEKNCYGALNERGR